MRNNRIDVRLMINDIEIRVIPKKLQDELLMDLKCIYGLDPHEEFINTVIDGLNKEKDLITDLLNMEDNRADLREREQK